MLRRAKEKAKLTRVRKEKVPTGPSVDNPANTKDEVIAMVPFFSSMEAGELARVVSESIEVKYNIGDVIIQEGDDADAMYVLMHGVASVEKSGEEVMTYEDVGQAFGELAMLSSSTKRLATVRASTAVLLLCISKANFLGVSAMEAMVRKTMKIAVLGAGPIGLEFAAAATLRGLQVLVLEQGDAIGKNVRAWGHVRLFSPNKMNISSDGRAVLEAAGKELPPDGATY